MKETVTFSMIRSSIGSTRKVHAILTGLGLSKMHKKVTRKDTKELRGMLAKVQHLVKIED